MLYEQRALTRTAETAATISIATAERSNADNIHRAETQRVLGEYRTGQMCTYESMMCVVLGYVMLCCVVWCCVVLCGVVCCQYRCTDPQP